MNSPLRRPAPWGQAQRDPAGTPREARFDLDIKSMPRLNVRDSPEPNYRLHSERQLERRSLDDSSQAYDRGVLEKIGGAVKHRPSASNNSVHDSPLLMSSPSLGQRYPMKHDGKPSDARTSVTPSPPRTSITPEIIQAAASPKLEQELDQEREQQQLAGRKRRASDDFTGTFYPQPASNYQPLLHESLPASSTRHLSPRPEGSPNSPQSITALDPELRKSGPSEIPTTWEVRPPTVHGSSLICDCCPKKPKRFAHEEDLRLHHLEKQYTCLYCPNRFKNKNEAERHQNSLHLRRHSWTCAALQKREQAFHVTLGSNGTTDQCGYCGDEFVNPPDWPARFEHLEVKHKFGECNQAKKFFRADHFRQHLKHSHAGTSGRWTNMLEHACRKDEAPPVPMNRGQMMTESPLATLDSTPQVVVTPDLYQLPIPDNEPEDGTTTDAA